MKNERLIKNYFINIMFHMNLYLYETFFANNVICGWKKTTIP